MNTYRNLLHKRDCLSLLFIFCFSIFAYAQQEEKANRNKGAGSSVSVHLGELYEKNTLDKDEVIWMREIYRKLDLIQQKENTPLYYPAETNTKNANFFANVFRLLYTNKVPAYEYRDGEEVFDDSSK
ncbi:MAG TPA: hypothetical protein DDY68_00650, partial [Porphyromonadaceae bacterium]|nr:hypothetical protein [Porphyromonadaceae bacterium]